MITIARSPHSQLLNSPTDVAHVTLWRMADPSIESKSRDVSRRRFGKRAVLAAAGIFSSPALIAQRKAASASLPPADQDAVTNVIRKYGDRLSPAQRRRARETLIQHQRMLMRIR
jgi:hypothetical protein